MQTLLSDLRFAARMLARTPGTTIAALVALSLGIGANTAIFSVVKPLMLTPPPFEQVDRLVVLVGGNTRGGMKRNSLSRPDFEDFRTGNPSFAQAAAWSSLSANLSDSTGTGEPERVPGVQVSVGFFETLRVRPALGRSFLPEEEEPGRNMVVALSHELWRRRFGSDPSIVGTPITLNGSSYTVVGVMPADFSFPPGGPSLWVPLARMSPTDSPRGDRFLSAIARLKDGVGLDQARAATEALSKRLMDEYPGTNTGWGIEIVPLHEHLVRGGRPLLLALSGAVGFVLLIACANVANLVLARGMARQREFAIRAAMGASRRRIVRQLVTESLLLSLTGGALGLLVSLWGIDMIRSLIPDAVLRSLPSWGRIGIDRGVLLFTLALSLVTGPLFGLLPALTVSRADLIGILKESAAATTAGRGRARLSGIFVVAQVALALVLLIGAALLISGFESLSTRSLGFRPEGVLTMQVSLPVSVYPDQEKVDAFYDQTLERIAALPGIAAAGAASWMPMAGSIGTSNFTIEGRALPAPGEDPIADRCHVSPGYFTSMGIQLVRGRPFTRMDKQGAPSVVVVSERLARVWWPGEDAIGKRVTLGRAEDVAESEWSTVVGIVGDVRRTGLDLEDVPTIYFPLRQMPAASATLIVRTAGQPAALAGTIAREIHDVDPALPVYNVRTMAQVVAHAVSAPRFGMTLLSTLSLLAMLLAAVGIYGVMAGSTVRRTREFGIRMALGAQRRDVLRLVAGQGLRLVGAGIVLGLALSIVLTRLLSAALYWVTPRDLFFFFFVPMLLAAVACAACIIPARRATRVDPMTALRHE